MKLGVLINGVNVINNHARDTVSNMGSALHIAKFLASVATETKFWDDKVNELWDTYGIYIDDENGGKRRVIPDEKMEEFKTKVVELSEIDEDVTVILTEADVSGFKNVTLDETVTLMPLLVS